MYVQVESSHKTRVNAVDQPEKARIQSSAAIDGYNFWDSEGVLLDEYNMQKETLHS